MTAYWPAGLPDEQFLTLTIEPADTRLQTQPDLGPPRIRARSILNVTNTDIPQIWTGAQNTIFDAFWTTTLQGGCLRFYWKHPATGAQVQMSFRLRPAPKPRVSHQLPDLREYDVMLPLRIHT